MKECRFSKRLREAGKIVTTEDWLEKHKDHGGVKLEDAGHPSGDMWWQVCKCGAKHLGGKEYHEVHDS